MSETVLAQQNPDAILSDDGVPLKQKLARTTRKLKMRAFLLTLPLVLFLVVSFVLPIGQMLLRSINNPAGSNVLPVFAELIQDWDEQGLPNEAVFEAFVKDVQTAQKNREIGKTVGNLATRVNYEMPGTRSLFTSAGRKLKKVTEAPYKEALLATNKKWDNPVIWRTLKRVSRDYTPAFYMAALDRKYDDNGNIVKADPLYQIYVSNFIKTLWMSSIITFFCFLLAFPVSYLLSTLPLRTSNLLMILVLLPFWTSLLVRTTAWIAILQTEGIINDILVFIGFVADDARIQMIYNQTGTIISMVHILLPFMILPLFSVMKTIPPSYMRAARSMGGTPFNAFRRVYFPQTIPGIAAGTLLVFILSIGFYITPALVGGEDGILISNLIAYHIQKSLNWSLGAALGAILLVIVLVLYWIYNKLVGIEKLSFG
uniref:Spermidine Putrescine ABC transporter permease component PotB (TC 3.A.1.11.1) n=1 Tax=uncultured Thiotrichaceae bacterium TaxID=298394 RepID=A0A6S6SUD7_9GAMM|nr:MAG: Spermidine Putrescine ABC transporter permease component PotB (TC 3.A.1.11.1) [uncultured Thiotrichaceae bacterium]